MILVQYLQPRTSTNKMTFLLSSADILRLKTYPQEVEVTEPVKLAFQEALQTKLVQLKKCEFEIETKRGIRSDP